MKLNLIVALLLVSTSALAGEGGVMSLMPKFLNFGVLLIGGFLILRKPVVAFFNSQAEEVEAMMTAAADKDKKAQEALGVAQSKLDNLEKESASIVNTAHKDAETLAQETVIEKKQTIEKMKRDAAHKLTSEKNALEKDMNSLLLDEVIGKAKTTIAADGSLREKATNKLTNSL